MDQEIDRVLVARVVTFITGHVREGVIPLVRLQRAYRLTGVDGKHQRAVEACLQKLGVSVELPTFPATVPDGTVVIDRPSTVTSIPTASALPRSPFSRPRPRVQCH